MNREEWRKYNREKQREYRGYPQESLVKRNNLGQVVEGYSLRNPDFYKDSQSQRCSFCKMLLTSEYHMKYPLQGCLNAKKIHAKRQLPD